MERQRARRCRVGLLRLRSKRDSNRFALGQLPDKRMGCSTHQTSCVSTPHTCQHTVMTNHVQNNTRTRTQQTLSCEDHTIFSHTLLAHASRQVDFAFVDMSPRFGKCIFLFGLNLRAPVRTERAEELRRAQNMSATPKPRDRDDEADNIFSIFRQIAREVSEGDQTQKSHLGPARSRPPRHATKPCKRMSL